MAGQVGGAGRQQVFAAGLAALQLQAGAASNALPHFAIIERTRAAWLSGLDVATDTCDLQHLVALAADAPTEFAAGLSCERAARLQEA